MLEFGRKNTNEGAHLFQRDGSFSCEEEITAVVKRMQAGLRRATSLSYAVVGGILAFGCGGNSTDSTNSTDSHRPGLEVVGVGDIPIDGTGTPHATQFLVDGERIIVADSNGGIIGHDITAPLFQSPTHKFPSRCTTIAHDASTERIFCAAADSPRILTMDGNTGEVIHTYGPVMDIKSPGWRSLAVDDHWLYGAKVPEGTYGTELAAGLYRFPILNNGSLGEMEMFKEGQVIAIAGTGDHLVQVDREGNITRLMDDKSINLSTNIPLSINVRTDMDDGIPRATVSYGDEGAYIVQLDTMTVEAHITPSCVVRTADIDPRDPKVVVFGCNDIVGGIYINTDDKTQRLFGTGKALYGITDVHSLKSDHGSSHLIALDWRRLVQYKVDTSGEVLHPVAPPGFVIHEGQKVEIPVFNPSSTLRHWREKEFPPEETTYISTAQFAHDRQMPAAEVYSFVFQEELDRRAKKDQNEPSGQDGRNGVDVTTTVVHPESAIGNGAQVALGDTFLLKHREDAETHTFMFVTADCALQWPDILNAVSNANANPGEATTIVIASTNDMSTWDTDFLNLFLGPSSAQVSTLYALSGLPSFKKFVETYNLGTKIGGPDTSVIYKVDKNGFVTGIDRLNRGRYAQKVVLY